MTLTRNIEIIFIYFDVYIYLLCMYMSAHYDKYLWLLLSSNICHSLPALAKFMYLLKHSKHQIVIIFHIVSFIIMPNLITQ